MRRIRKLIADARRKIADGGDAIQVYKELGLELMELLADLQEQGHIQFEFTFRPFGFKIHLPKTDEEKKVE